MHPWVSRVAWGVFQSHPSVWKERLIQDSFQRQSSEWQAQWLLNHLRKHLRHLAPRGSALLEWRDCAEIFDDRSFAAAWATLPVMTKQMLNERFPEATVLREIEGRGIRLSTGGSTGEPTRFVHDLGMQASKAAAAYRATLACGWSPGLPILCLWGAERDIGRAQNSWTRIKYLLRNHHIIGGYKLSDQTVDAVVEFITRNRKIALYGFTSMLEFVARRVIDRGLPIPRNAVAAAWSGGETVSPTQQQLFADAFGIPFCNHYGGREIGVIACQYPGKTELAVSLPHVVVEVVDAENRPVPTGTSGRLLVTSPSCRGTPLVRYQIGDMAIAGLPHPSGVGVSTLRGVTGRLNGLVQLSSGRTLCNLFWNHLFKDIPEVTCFQVAVADVDRFEVRVTGQPLSVDRKRSLEELVSKATDGSTVSIEHVDAIPRSASGKLIQVVRRAA